MPPMSWNLPIQRQLVQLAFPASDLALPARPVHLNRLDLEFACAALRGRTPLEQVRAIRLHLASSVQSTVFGHHRRAIQKKIAVAMAVYVMQATMSLMETLSVYLARLAITSQYKALVHAFCAV